MSAARVDLAIDDDPRTTVRIAIMHLMQAYDILARDEQDVDLIRQIMLEDVSEWLGINHTNQERA